MRIAGAALLMALESLVVLAPAYADPDQPSVSRSSAPTAGCGDQVCIVGATDSVVKKTLIAVVTTGATAVKSSMESLCKQQPMPTQPAADSPLWAGHTPADGFIAYDICPTNSAAVPFTNSQPYFVGNGTTPTAVSPEALALSAQAAIRFVPPVLHFGPDTQIAVNRWLYLWVDNPGPLIAQATAGAVTVTLTATLSSVTWSMGEPANPKAPKGPPATITCDGPGRDPGPTANANISKPAASDACVYAYRWRSLPERTGGTATWPVTATANWTVTWTSNVGVGGALDAPPQSSTTPVSVGEWRSELVAGPN